MKKRFTSLLAGLFFLLFAGSAQAYYFEDMIGTWGPLNLDAALIVQGSPLTYTHDINDSVDFAAGHYVTDATLELDFTNDLADDVGSRQVIFWTVYWDHREFASYGFDGNAWTSIDEVDNGQYDIIVNVDWLNNNGMLDVSLSVSNPLGTATAWLDHSKLSGNAVPEPATLMLLGCGLLGIAGVSRKKTCLAD